MKKAEFISVSRRMTKEYINQHVLKGDGYVSLKGVSIIGFGETVEHLKCIMYSQETPEVVYKVVYNKEKDEINSEIIKKNGFRTLR